MAPPPPTLLLDGGGGMVAALAARGPLAGRRTPRGSGKISGAGSGSAGRRGARIMEDGPWILKGPAYAASEGAASRISMTQ